MEQGRTRKGLKNVVFSLSSSIIVLVLSFLGRTVFVQILSTEYLGLNGLFTNILSFLSLAELGIGSALNFALYRPIKENDTELIKSLMQLYKKLYTLIGSAVLLVGLSITPFLQYFIKDMPEGITGLRFYYILYVINSGISYFYTYKRAIFICNQQEYVSYISTTVARIVTTCIQIVVLIATRNYGLYLMVAIVCTVTENIVISCLADKQYCYLKDKNVQALPVEMTNQIKENVFALLIHKIAASVVFSTDNIIISSFVGLTAVGLYSNYTLIIHSVNNILAKVFGTLTASVGELMVSSDKEHKKQVFFHMLFANMWLYGWCSVCFLCLMQPFITLWLDSTYLLGIDVLYIAILNFYFSGLRKTVWVFKDAAGIYKQDRIKPIIEVILNIGISIPLAIKWGISGVLIGTISSNMLWAFWFEAYVLTRECFEKGMKEFALKQILYFLLWLSIGGITLYLCSFFSTDVIGFAFQMLICIFVPNVCLIIIFRRTREFSYFEDTFKRLFNR